jgi:hypothetical protein
MNRKIKSTPPEPALGLDMPFDEALKRFIGTDPKEVEASIGKAKKKKPPGSETRKPSGGTNQSETVVSLRSRRVRKRNTGL